MHRYTIDSLFPFIARVEDQESNRIHMFVIRLSVRVRIVFIRANATSPDGTWVTWALITCVLITNEQRYRRNVATLLFSFHCQSRCVRKENRFLSWCPAPIFSNQRPPIDVHRHCLMLFSIYFRWNQNSNKNDSNDDSEDQCCQQTAEKTYESASERTHFSLGIFSKEKVTRDAHLRLLIRTLFPWRRFRCEPTRFETKSVVCDR